MSKKKIIIIGPAYPYRGGNSLFISHLYHALCERFDVSILNYSLLYPSILFPGTTQYDKSNSPLKKAPNRRVVNSINPFSWIHAASIINSEKPDLIVFDWWHPFFGPCHFGISAFLQKRFKDKILFITENFISHEGNVPDRLLTRLGLSNASSFLCLSAKVESELREINKNKPVYRSELPVYDCYEIEPKDRTAIRSEMGFQPEHKVLLFFGYIRKYKGLDILINAMPHLVAKDKNFRLLIAGEFYDNPAEYQEVIDKAGVRECITLVNQFIPNEDVIKYYGASDLVVLPYRSATQSGILNVAYGFVKPVVITDVGGLAEFVDEDKTAVIVPPENPVELAKGIEKYFEISQKENFPENIRKRVSENSFAKIADLFEQIVSETAK